MHSRNSISRSGFTLVEIMIVVAVIGMLAALAIPAFSLVRFHSRINATLNDYRIYYAAFQQYEADHRGFPNLPAVPGILPADLAGYVDGQRWGKGPAVGGQWYYKSTCFGALGGRPALGIVGLATMLPDAQAMLAIDQALDNGDLSSGGFIQQSAAAYYLYLDQ